MGVKSLKDAMNPELKFHSIVISLTTFIVFTAWSQLTTLISSSPWVSVFAAGLISLGLYRFIAMVSLSLFRNVPLVKKFILGAKYMEGTWIGFFIGHENKIRYLVETFEQDLGELVIRGTVYRDDGTHHCSYVSQNATIDIRNGKLSYSYDADSVSNTHINPGLARFDLVRESKESPPKRITGYSSDLFHPNKLMAFEEKITEKTSMDVAEAFEKSLEVYEKYKRHTGIGS